MDSMENDGLLPAIQADISCVKADVESLRIGVKADIGRLDASVRRLAIEIVDVKTELREFKDVVATKSDLQRFIDAVEKFAGKAQSYDAAKVLHGQALTEVQLQVKDHEQRIKGLEDRLH